MCAGTPAPAEAQSQLAQTIGALAARGDDAAPYLNPVQQGAQLVVDDISGISGTAISVSIRLPAASLTQPEPLAGPSFILFRGLPDAVSLSRGFRMKSSWAVSLKDAQDLALLSPPNYRGSHVIEVVLQTGDATTPVSRQFRVNLRPAEPAPSANAAPPDAAPIRRMGETEVIALLQKGRALLESGNLASARMLFTQLVRQGDSRGAFAMGQSYDPDVLKAIIVVGLTPDVEVARQWYRRAAELGSTDARNRLGALNDRTAQ